MAIFYLSHWNGPQKVFVPEEIHIKFKPYHFSIVRSLHRCLQKKYSGAILNYDDGINVPLAFQGLFQALITAQEIKLPILVIASNNNVVEWHYHLSKLGETIILNNSNYDRILENSNFSVILVPESNLKLLQPYRENEFSFVVAEDFDLLATKILFKKLSGQFNVALTKRDFMIDRDCKILWHTLNWINPGEFGKLNDFVEFDRDHLENLRNPYDEVWFSYNHNIGDYNFDDEEHEKKEYQEILKGWAKQNNLPFENACKQKTRKRKTNFSNDNIKAKKRLENSDGEMYDLNYHETETQLAEEVTNAKNKNENLRNAIEVKGLRDVTDLNYSKLIRENVKLASERVEKSPVKLPFLRNKNLNMERKAFKFLDDENKKVTDKELPQTKNNKIVEVSAEHGNEGTGSANKTSMHVEDNNLSKQACDDAVSRNGKGVCEKSTGSLKETNIETLAINSHTSLSFVTKKDSHKILPSEDKSANVSVDGQKQVFPSLEDILTFKKKDISDLLFLRMHAKQMKKPPVSERVSKSALEREGVASLEEVFKCKRKLVGVPDIVKKLNTKSSFGAANCNNMSMRFTFQGDLKRMEVCERIIYTDIPIPGDYFKSVELVSKATQTSNQVTTTISACKSLNTSPKNMNVGNKNLNKRVSEGNLKEKRLEKSITCKIENDSVSIEKKDERIPKTNSALTMQDNSLKNSINVEAEEDDGQELLLSIVEGRFVSKEDDIETNTEKLKNSENDTANNRSANTFKRYNSKTLLGSLFGDKAECLEEEIVENLAFKNKSDKSKSNSQLPYQHLKVRTIDQINAENSNRNGADIYDSYKLLFGSSSDSIKDKHFNDISKSKKFGTNKYNRHNLSSLFG